MVSEISFDWPIVGHGKIKDILQRNIGNNNLAQAFVFEGPSQVGKTLTAKLFANSILCESFNIEGKKTLPCGVCNACRQFNKNIHPDLYYLERELNDKTGEKKSFITVAQVRSLQEKIKKRSFLNSYKLVIIPEAQCLNQEASNSLLKTLEEPGVNTIMILLTPSRDLLLPTIQSRCQIFKFLPVTRDEIYAYLLTQGANRSNAKELAAFAQGRPTVAMHLLNSGEELTSLKKNSELLLGLFGQNVTEKFKTVENLINSNETDQKLGDLLDCFTLLVRDLIMISSYNIDLIAHSFLQEKLEQTAKRYTLEKLKDIMEEIEMTKVYLQQNINPKFALENLILNI